MLTTFDDILGQTEAIDMLRRAHKADRLPHGLLFAGPIGVGKATTASALGALFLCERPRLDKPCGSCDSCRVFEAGNHPDYHVIVKELIRIYDKTGTSKAIDLSVKVIRPEVVERAAHSSVMGRGKVFIIEQADAMNPQAQNALLKTLEEPAGRTLLVLLTDQPGAMLPTIRSRCQMVRFASLPPRLVIEQLQKRGISPADAADAVRFAGGSLGLALKWIEDGVIAPAKELVRILDAIFAGRSGVDLSDWFKSAAEAYAQKQLQRDELGSKDQASREGLSLYLRIATDHIRQQFVDTKDLDDMERACNAIDAIARAEEYLDANVNIPLVFQQLTLALGV